MTAVKDILSLLVAVVTAACEKKLTESQIVKFHGKVCVCVQECIFEVRAVARRMA